jgi:hypothetical protein
MSDPQTFGKGESPELKTDPESGREYWLYPSGMSKWKDSGLFRSAPAITPVTEDPRGMLLRRNAKSRQIAREAIDEGCGLDPSQWGTGEGWRRLIVHTVQTYLKSSNVRGLGEVLSKLAAAAGYASQDEDSRKVVIENMNNLALPPEILVALVEQMERDRRGAETAKILDADSSPKPGRTLG